MDRNRMYAEKKWNQRKENTKDKIEIEMKNIKT